MTTQLEPNHTSGRELQRRPRQNFETWSWLFMRVSGLVLVFLALFHFSVTHLLNDVAKTNYDFVSRRWQNSLWRLFDWLLLALALAHGLNGVRWSIDDYVRNPAVRTTVKGVLYTVTATLFLYGTLTIITF
jgi:succinate dehydrogenase / fumarate reductase membrane anchor subunit